MTGINLLNIFVNFPTGFFRTFLLGEETGAGSAVSRLFFIFAHARRAVSLAKRYAFSFARAWLAGFFGAKVLLWADGKKRLRLMSLWCQRQLSAKFLRFFERNRICWTECKILTFRSHSPLKSAEKRSIAVNLRKNGALPLTCK